MARSLGAWLLAGSLAVVFVWFGALKLVGQSPVEDLVARAIPWAPLPWTLVVLGIVEIGIGLAWLTPRAPRATFAVFLAQMLGTFALVVTAPHLVYGDTPWHLSMVGEFLVKNLVLVAAGFAVMQEDRD